MAGTIDEPQNIYLIEHKFVETCNCTLICGIIHDVLKEVNCDKDNFVMLMSDAASYMVASSKVLKFIYPKMIFLTCFAHLLHNCAIRIISTFPEVDKLIASMRMATLKSRKRCELFKGIPLPPDVVVTRWGSWLNAVEYYNKYYTTIKDIIQHFEDTGKITENVKNIIKSKSILLALVEIKNDYSMINILISKFGNFFFLLQML